MTKQTMTVAGTFNWQQSIYGACDPVSKTLLLILEARDIEEARTRVKSVAPLLGISQSNGLLVFELDEMPSGVPTFLNAFFAGRKIGFKRGDVALGTTNLQ